MKLLKNLRKKEEILKKLKKGKEFRDYKTPFVLRISSCSILQASWIDLANALNTASAM